MHKNRFLQSGEERDGVRTINLDDFYDVSKDVLAEPTVNGYGLLATPIPAATPKLVVNIEMGRHFQMPETPERDKLAFRLADEQSRRRAAVTTVFRTPSHRSANTPALFSPAGQKLLEERLKVRLVSEWVSECVSE